MRDRGFLLRLFDAALIGLTAGLLFFLLEISARFAHLLLRTDEQPPTGYPAFLSAYSCTGLAAGVAVFLAARAARGVRRSPSAALRYGAAALALAALAAVAALVAARLGLSPRAALFHLGRAALLAAAAAALGWGLLRLRQRHGAVRFATGFGALALVWIGGHLVFLHTVSLGRLLERLPHSDTPAEKPNVLLVTIDTLRADRLGAYGSPRGLSANADRLAREGAVFQRVVAHSPWTRPSFASLLTSAYPSEHGAFVVLDADAAAAVATEEKTLYDAPLRDDRLTMAEILARHGYRNLALQTNWHASEAYGFDRGFDLFLYRALFVPPLGERSLLGRYGRRLYRLLGGEPPPPYTTVTPDADAVYRSFATLFAHGVPEPFFIWVNFVDPHSPYLAREPGVPIATAGVTAAYEAWDGEVTTEVLSRAYDDEIRFVDHYLGEMLDLLRGRGLLDDTIVILTSDHGEEFDDHGTDIRLSYAEMKGRYHGQSLYAELLRVPLILRYPPRIPPGLKLEGLVRHVDLLPTVLDLAEIEPGELGQRFSGVSLVPLIDGDGGAAPRPAFGERNLFGPQMRSVEDDRYKLIVDLGRDTHELYDVRVDPAERVDLAAARQDETDRLLGLLAEWAARMGPLVPPSPEGAPESAEDRERRRALGYVR